MLDSVNEMLIVPILGYEISHIQIKHRKAIEIFLKISLFAYLQPFK